MLQISAFAPLDDWSGHLLPFRPYYFSRSTPCLLRLLTSGTKRTIVNLARTALNLYEPRVLIHNLRTSVAR